MRFDDLTLLDACLIGFATFIVVAMLRPGLRNAPFWRAVVTPLASIIGSGFLVVVPLLANITGIFAIVAIGGIVLLSFCMGSALRFNILLGEQSPEAAAGSRSVCQPLEHVSNIALAFAYVISITFYIRLMSGFVLTSVDANTPVNANMMATLVLAFIGIYGWWRGLYGLERLEEYAVTIKLAIIAALLSGLAYYDMNHGYNLSALSAPHIDVWEGVRQLGGMLLIVQGFETSKYLGASYDARLRARTMSVAQLIAGVIYIVFVALAMPLMAPFEYAAPSETAIIKLSATVALILPFMLTLAATTSQFSAAIADTLGVGGVVEQESRQRLRASNNYPMVAALAIALLWIANIFEIVTLASRAFAFYYMLQALVAARSAARIADRWRTALYIVLAVVLSAIVLFAEPVSA